MPKQKLNFKNQAGNEIAAFLDTPEFQNPHNFVLFAHCFTCSKNLHVVQNISTALCKEGFAVLRFDFTGLGQSEGEFAQSNFQHNISDLICASEFLEERFQAPTVLIGHSLGGTAVLHAAAKIKSAKAIATIGSPFQASHVKHLIANSDSNKVNIGGRDFKINQEFIDVLDQTDSKGLISNLNKALLVLHSPQDKTVEIENAKEIYQKARHPKSFISLDGADHLLSKDEDAMYAGLMIANWSKRYIYLPSEQEVEVHGNATAINQSESLETLIGVGRHQILSDEPKSVGGKDHGPAPHELLAAGLASCTAMTLHMYAKRKEWEFTEIRVDVSHKQIKAENGDITEEFKRDIKIIAELEQKQLDRMLQIASKCPVHKTLERVAEIHSQLI